MKIRNNGSYLKKLYKIKNDLKKKIIKKVDDFIYLIIFYDLME